MRHINFWVVRVRGHFRILPRCHCCHLSLSLAAVNLRIRQRSRTRPHQRCAPPCVAVSGVGPDHDCSLYPPKIGKFARGRCRRGRSEILHLAINCSRLPLSSLKTIVNSDEGGRLNQGAGVVVFPRGELPPQNRGNTTTTPPPPGHGNTTTPPAQGPRNTTTPPLTSKSLPHPERGGGVATFP